MTIAPNDANTYLPGVIAIPSALTITNITQAFPMVVSFSVNSATEANTYIVGQVVKLNIPRPYGMFQANGLSGQILAIGETTMALYIDSTLFDTFVTPSSPTVTQPATLSPSGSRNLQYNTNNTQFVPFQSLNNIGN